MGKKLRRWAVATGVLTAGVLGLSGQWLDPWLWAYCLVVALMGLYALTSIDEDLAKERFHPPEPGADRLSLRMVRIIALAHLVVGALDTGRWHIAPVPGPVRAVALAGMTLSFALVFRAMIVNRYFSSVVRIQKDRGHRLVDKGPYAVVRHPGYAGMLPWAVFSALALGSWLAVPVALAYSALVFRRVLFEDAFLRSNLEGYEEYTRRVQYRLVPGLF